MKRSVGFYQASVTIEDLRKLLNAVPEDIDPKTQVRITVSATSNNPTDPGGEIRIRVEWSE